MGQFTEDLPCENTSKCIGPTGTLKHISNSNHHQDTNDNINMDAFNVASGMVLSSHTSISQHNTRTHDKQLNSISPINDDQNKVAELAKSNNSKVNDDDSNSKVENETKEEVFPDIGVTSPSRMPLTRLSSFSGVVSAAKAAKRLKARRQSSKDSDNNSK